MSTQEVGHGLCLGRRVGESVVIAPGTPHQCTVTVDSFSRGTIRLLFQAAKEIRIFRSELLDREDFEVAGGGRTYLDVNELGS